MAFVQGLAQLNLALFPSSVHNCQTEATIFNDQHCGSLFQICVAPVVWQMRSKKDFFSIVTKWR